MPDTDSLTIDWKMTPKGLWKGGGFVINPRTRVIRAQKKLFWPDSRILVINGMGLGRPTRVTPNGVARWEDVDPTILSLIVGEDVHVIEEAPDMTPFVVKLLATAWTDHHRWEAHVHVITPEDGQPGVLTSRMRSDDTNGYMPHYFSARSKDGKKVGRSRMLFDADTLFVDVSIKLRDKKGKVITDAKTISITRPPKKDRPAEVDYWAARRRSVSPEEQHKDFNPKMLDFVPEYPGHKGIEDYYYDCETRAINLDARPVPGGFSIENEWFKVVETLPGGEIEKIKGVRVYFRPSVLRGSGKPWICSCSAADGKPDGLRQIAVMNVQCPPGDLLDVLIQPFNQHNFPLPISKIVTTPNGPPVEEWKGDIPRVTMELYAYRRFEVDLPPFTNKENYIKSRDGETKKANIVLPKDKVSDLKRRIQRDRRPVYTDELRALFKRLLPEFTFVTDNFGNFAALPEQLWDEIIEYTDTETLLYDPVWRGCADFATDFKSEAGRLGAKVINIWDFGGGHAYCALLTTARKGDLTVRWFEPQTDEDVVQGQGMYSQEKGGLILAW